MSTDTQTNPPKLRYIKLQIQKRLALRLRRNQHNPGQCVALGSESGNYLGSQRFTEKTSMMIKKLIFTAALLSLALLGGCAKGGNGPCVVSCPEIDIEPQLGVVGLNVSVPLTLAFKFTSPAPVNWSIQPTSCGSACGTLTNVTTSTATYVGPSSVPSNASISIVATSQNDGGLSGSLGVTIIPITTNVAPVSPNVGAGLTQQYTAIALPDQAPQTFTWTCTVNSAACASFVPDPSGSGQATYKPTAGEECGSSGCVTISAVATVDPTGCTVDPKITCIPSQTTAVSSRVPAGTYAFEFSGYDKNGRALAVAGTFTVGSGGSITGFEDENEWNGSKFVTAGHNITGGSYSPLSGSNPISNNAGTLSLTVSGSPFPSTYSVVLDGAGDIQMIANDGTGNIGSGFAEPSANGKFNKGSSAAFAFGFTGVDSGNNHVGYAGLLPTNGVSTVTGGLIDVNDNGSASNSVCNATPPCTVTGSYIADGTVTNLWHMTLTAPIAMAFDFFVANGAENGNGNNPLHLYAISTDGNPAMLGTMTYQNPKITTYDNAALTGESVSALTGANDNVALVLGSPDGSGDFLGTFDWNNHGAIVSVPPSDPCSPPTICNFANTYASTNNNTGRYTIQMLGNPNGTPAVNPIPFVLYASGANSGYLLDPSSTAVITGTMNAQTGPKANFGQFASSSASGPYSVATTSNSVSSIPPLTMNLVLTSPGASVFNVTGVENFGAQSVSGGYVVGSAGNGTITLTSPAASKYVIYGTTETTFFMIDLDSGVTSQMFYLAQ
jgi:hypothetical protein